MNTCNNMLSPKAAAFSKALHNIDIVSTEDEIPNEESDQIDEDVITKNLLKRRWNVHPVKYTFNFNDECIIKLIQRYDKGKGGSNKSCRVTVERRCDLLRNKIIPNDWT